MRAVVVREHGGPETLRVTEVEPPRPRPGEVLIRVRATALNHLDTWVRRGVPGHRFPLPIIPGSDVVGVLEDGGVPGLSAGDEVVAAPFTSCGRCDECLRGEDVRCREYRILGESRDGGCAELVAVPATHVLPKPKGLSFRQAAASLLAPLTAYHMVHARAAVRSGERVLVTAAAGGVGSAAVQFAKRAGATVVAVVGSEAKRDAVTALGADQVVVVGRDADWEATLKAGLGRVSFEAVIDSVGAGAFQAGVKMLKPFGRFVTCGATAGAAPAIDLRRVFFLSLSVLGSTMGTRWELSQVLRMAAAGEYKPVIHAVLPLDRIADAHRMIEAREVVGKVVLEV
ncbi:MAG: zinc-binding dehydrogenase [Deltaproteobacteria bacterium]|nr:zinc-binding dehydrogenase [Deltaproteobacteria bacterium]